MHLIPKKTRNLHIPPSQYEQKSEEFYAKQKIKILLETWAEQIP